MGFGLAFFYWTKEGMMRKVRNSFLAVLMLAAVSVTGCVRSNDTSKLQHDAMEHARGCIAPVRGLDFLKLDGQRPVWISCIG